MKKLLVTITFFASIFLFSSCSSSENKNSDGREGKASDILNDVPSGELYYFYSKTCVHCANVNKYFLEEKVYENYNITKFEVSEDGVAKKMYDFATRYEVPEDSRGAVPFLISREKYWIGDTPIINAHKNGEFENAKKAK